MLRIYSLFFFVLLAILSTVAHAETNRAVTVIELFTSQGCHSCPPADRLLAQLDQPDNTITLSCHVTYWNFLGWQDTFAHEYCDRRQRSYQSKIIGNAGLYTPQMIINGRFGAVGSRQRTVEQAIDILQRANRLQAIDLFELAGNTLTITLPQIDADQEYYLTLFGTTGTQTVAIAHGENARKTIDYHNPIKIIQPLGQWNGEAKTIQQAFKQDTEVKAWVVLAQVLPIGEMVAAGQFIR